MAAGAIVFDMDGVLVDVTESYRETIQRTVEHFSGYRPSRTEIQDYKNRGGWNDDWALSIELIRKQGVAIEDDEVVVAYFQSIFLGNDGTPGLILRERWIACPGMLERLNERYDLAVFTGRYNWEARLTLDRCAGSLQFDPIVGADDVSRKKPFPDGLNLIQEMDPERKLWYVGDTVDDARSASAAGVPFIGIAAPGNPRYGELCELFRAENAIAILDDINGIPGVLP